MGLILEILFPVFAVVLLGYFAGRIGVLGERGEVTLNRFTYYFALPPLMFRLTAQASVDDLLRLDFVAVYIGGCLLVLALALIGGRLFFGLRKPDLAFHGMNTVFGNTAFIGIPLFVSAFGDDGALPAIVGSVAASFVFISGTVASAELARSQNATLGQAIRRVVRVLSTNPLLIASLAGIVFSVLGLGLPEAAWDALSMIGGAAVPCALFALGMSLVGKRVTSGLGEVVWLVLLKLVVHPVLVWLLSTSVLPLDGPWQPAAILLAAMPTGSLVYVIAQQYDHYVERSSTVIFVSTVISVVTMGIVMRLIL